MLAPNPSLYYNGRASFVNPMYLKKAQFEKPCLYKVPYDKDHLANIFAPNCDETLILKAESRSKLDKDLSRQAFHIVKHNINFQTIIEMDWESRLGHRMDKPITHEITVLVKDLLMPLVENTRVNASEFEKVLKEEMFEDLQYVQYLEKELDELQSNKTEFSNGYDLLLQECLSKDILCVCIKFYD
ncbi:hypothetical protein Tco_1509191 [Tanacetum coccineum]